MLLPENYPIHVAAYWGHVHVVKFLIVQGADQSKKNHWTENAWLCAEEGTREADYSLSTLADTPENYAQRVKFQSRKKGCEDCKTVLDDASAEDIALAKKSADNAALQRSTVLEMANEQYVDKIRIVEAASRSPD